MNNDEQIENDNNDNIDDILINQDDEQIEIQNNEVEDDKETITIEASMDTLYIKELSYDEQLPHIKNPILLLKETLTLELDSISRNKYYIKFNYDSLLNFNCFISFKVSKNKSKKNLSKLVNISPEKYELSYISNSNINTKIFKDLPKGKNVTISENSENYTASFQLGTANAETVNTKTFVIEDNIRLSVTNTLEGSLPTGINMGMPVFLIIMAVSLAGTAFLLYRRKMNDSSE